MTDPGADRAGSEAASDDIVCRPLHFFVLAAGTSLVVALHQAYRTHALYVAPHGAGALGLAGAGAGLVLGAGIAFRLLPFAEGAVRPAFFVVAFTAALSSFAPFAGFANPSSVAVALGCVVGLVAAATVAGILAYRATASASLVLGLVPFLLAPARLVAALAALLVVESAAARTGFLRSGVVVAAVLAVVAEGYPGVRRFLHGVPRGSAAAVWITRAALGAAVVGAVGAAERLLPAQWVARFPDEIVFARDGAISEYAVVASPVGYELYVDGQLAVSPLDEERRTAALVRPAMHAAERTERVLVLHGGFGAVERAVLDDPRVKALVTVTPDPERLRLARSLSLPEGRSRGVFDSPRVHAVVAEPLPWLAAHPEARFDVIIADFPLPLGYREGKYYTRFTFERLANGLAPGGVAVVPGVSGEALSGIVATLESAGLSASVHHAPVPSIGLESFVIAARRALPGAASGGAALDVGGDLAVAPDGRISTLSDQWIVQAFETSRDRR